VESSEGWTLRELVARAARVLAAADVRAPNGRVTELPDGRVIRWYTTIGLVDRPSAMRGRTALYGPRHLLQVVAIKRRQAQGRTLAEIQLELTGATDTALRRVADLPPQLELPHRAPTRLDAFCREARDVEEAFLPPGDAPKPDGAGMPDGVRMPDGAGMPDGVRTPDGAGTLAEARAAETGAGQRRTPPTEDVANRALPGGELSGHAVSRGAVPGSAIHDGAGEGQPTKSATAGQRRFWTQAPTVQLQSMLSGIRLAGGVVLLLPATPDVEDLAEIESAAGPLLELLAARGLLTTDPNASRNPRDRNTSDSNASDSNASDSNANDRNANDRNANDRNASDRNANDRNVNDHNVNDHNADHERERRDDDR
jgi:hypothetical protein